MAQKRRKDKISGKTVRKIIIILVILIVVILAGIRFLRKKVNDNFAQQSESTVQTVQVTTGSISTTVSGSGTLTDEDSVKTEIPATVTLTKLYVKSGDTVKEGDILATVDSASVLSSMADLQAEIDDLDEDLASAEEDSAASTIKASVSGRVKVIYTEVGDDVASTMYDKGALMLLSLDGYMAVDVETTALKADNSVKVKVGDSTYSGTVEKVVDDVATVLISDKKVGNNKKATVTKNGKEVGTGKTYIHESLAITGYAGTVEAIKVSKNDYVDAGDSLLTLTDTEYSANYAAILKKRNAVEEKLQNLITIYKKGAVYASCDGTLTEVTDNSEEGAEKSSSSNASSAYSMGSMMGASSTSSSSSSSDDSTNSVFAICPNTQMILTISMDESDILSVKEGQEAVISVDSISDQTFTGSVTSIETTGTSSSGVTTYNVELTLTKESNMLQNMTASAAITIEGVDNALLLPADAVNKTSSSAYVYTSYDEETDTLGDMVEVKTGINNGNYVEIQEGLGEGATVYYKKAEENNGFNFGGFGGGNMPSGGFDGSNMPSGMPSGGGSGSGMPSGMPSGGSSGSGKPSGMPSGGSGSGNRPSFGGN